MSEDQLSTVRELFKEGKTVRQIRKLLGLSEQYDQEILKAYGSNLSVDTTQRRTGYLVQPVLEVCETVRP
jgi:hypothetical protein